MAAEPSKKITELLTEWGRGDRAALDALTPLVYSELRRMARFYLRRGSLSDTIQSGTLIHEAYLRLVDQRRVAWQNRAHFFAIAAQLMRRILVDHARRRRAAKRGGTKANVSLDALDVVPQRGVDLLGLDEALNRLAAFDPQQGRIVELRFFGGLSIEETAQVLGVSPAGVKREWAMARTWLRREMCGEGER